mmetsp:Transcript_1120/g.1405  ORF Transcript_1120/g.1405 Transcript_1120/m.1405 type:complete len:134 (+) Transcript_1120:70-471(+)
MNLTIKYLFVLISFTMGGFVTAGESKVGHLRARRLEGEDSWRDRVKEKGEALFAEKKRAAIRAACYKDWKPGCRRIVEWAKKTGRIKGAEQQELLEFARNVIANAEKDGDLVPTSNGGGGGGDDERPPTNGGM